MARDDEYIKNKYNFLPRLLHLFKTVNDESLWKFGEEPRLFRKPSILVCVSYMPFFIHAQFLHCWQQFNVVLHHSLPVQQRQLFLSLALRPVTIQPKFQQTKEAGERRVKGAEGRGYTHTHSCWHSHHQSSCLSPGCTCAPNSNPNPN